MGPKIQSGGDPGALSGDDPGALFDGDILQDSAGQYWRIVGSTPTFSRAKLPGLPPGHAGRIRQVGRGDWGWDQVPIVALPETPVATRASVLADIEKLLGAPWMPAPDCASLSVDAVVLVDTLKAGLSDGWDKLKMLLAEKDPERRLQMARWWAQNKKQATDDIAGRIGDLKQMAPAFGPYAALVILVVEALQALVRIVGAAQGPQPQDFTLDELARWSYRGFGAYPYLQANLLPKLKEAQTAAAVEELRTAALVDFINLVDQRLSAVGAALGMDLLCAFPARTEADYSMEDLEEVRTLAKFQPARVVYQRLDRTPPRYLLEALPEPDKLKAAVQGAPSPVAPTVPAVAPTVPAVPPTPPPSRPNWWDRLRSSLGEPLLR